jgi:hypothetical protein
MVLAMFTAIIRMFARELLMRKLQINNSFTELVFFDIPQVASPPAFINWRSLYPFYKTNESAPQAVKTSKGENFRAVYLVYRQAVENYTSMWFVKKTEFADMLSQYKKIINWNLGSEYYEYAKGYSHLKTALMDRKIDFEPLANNLNNFYKFLQSEGIDLLYFQVADKICKTDILPDDLNFTNQNLDNFMKELSKRNIPHIDLRDNIHGENLGHRNLFYHTDGHWRVETGLWACGIVSNYLNKNYGFEIDTDLFLPDNFHYFNDKRGADDFAIMYPDFATDISFEIPARAMARHGSFEMFYKRDDGKYYGSYLFGNNAVMRIHNNLIPDGKKVLIITDSFGGSFVPFFSLGLSALVFCPKHFATCETWLY